LEPPVGVCADRGRLQRDAGRRTTIGPAGPAGRRRRVLPTVPEVAGVGDGEQLESPGRVAPYPERTQLQPGRSAERAPAAPATGRPGILPDVPDGAVGGRREDLQPTVVVLADRDQKERQAARRAK